MAEKQYFVVCALNYWVEEKFMTGYIGCIGLLGVAGFILLLYLLRKQNDNEMTLFYKTHSLYRTKDEPPNVRENLGGSDNLYCCRATLTTAAGENIAFGWWEWYLKSSQMINGAPSVSFTHFLAVSFAPNSVSDDFINTALQSTDRSADSAAQKVKDFFVADTQNPYRAEILTDGTLLICWQVVYRRDDYEAKLEWLKNNIAPPTVPESNVPEKVEDITPDEPEIIEITAPDESNIAGTVFYTHDGYPMLRHKFSSAWANLELEIHHWSAVFQHEGRDEFDSDAAFGDPNRASEIAFALTDETTVRKARQLFSETYGGATDILRDGLAVKDDETLAACNAAAPGEI